MKIVTVVGARPQFIKASAFSRAVVNRHEEIIVHTGQHFDANMSDVFFEQLEIPKPKYNLGISGGSHGKMTGNMIPAIEEIIVEEAPHWVLIYGDTNSTLAAALATVKLGVPVAHVEAGGRIKNLANPEEVNRIVSDHVSSLLFAPTEYELENLRKENLGERTYVVGNIMYDSYLRCCEMPWNREKAEIYNFEGERVSIPYRYYYLTCHRQENTNYDALYEIFCAMNELEFPTIYPVHPRNQEIARKLCERNDFSKLILTQPVGYVDSIHLLNGCEKVITDSGGLQCEAFYAQKQCITVFDWVAWPQTMVDNRNQLAKPSASDILQKLSKVQKINSEYQPFGDGHAAERIIDILEKENHKFYK